MCAASKMTYKCNECGTGFSRIFNLRNHAKKFHPKKVSDLAPYRYRKTIATSKYCCDICKKKFNHKASLTRHLKTHNITQTKANPDRSSLKVARRSKKCPLCEYHGQYSKHMHEHFKNVHDIQLFSKKLSFGSIEDFDQWKITIENETNSKFVKNYSHTFKSQAITNYICHRTGCYVPEGKGERRMRAKGTVKINAFCPASIHVQISKENEISVEYLESHVGHVTDIDHSYSVRHSSDSMNVESWVVDMQKIGDCIVFYKPQGTILNEQPQLKQEDFVLIIMTPAQCEVLKEFGSHCICIDGMDGLNNYNFELYTLLIIDDMKEGFPCAFLISNRTDTYIFTVFFNEIKMKAGVILPKIFMSDLADTYFNAWVQVMGNPEKRLFCTWHIDQAWKTNLPKIKSEEKQATTYTQLRTLLEERDPIVFERMLDQFCNLSDQDTTDFIIYFKENYQKTRANWADCYKLQSEVSTNMHLEYMHRTIKYVYFGGKKRKTLDKSITALMRFVRNKLNDRLIVVNEETIPSKSKTIRDRHKKMETMDPASVVSTEYGWEILSSSSSEIYFIQDVRKSCDCPLTCSECEICIHKYRCSCLDSSVTFNMCKHIHLLAQYQKENDNSRIAITATDDTMEGADSIFYIYSDQTNDDADESGLILSQLSTNNQENNLSLEDRQGNIMTKFQQILYGDMSTEKLDIIENIVDSLPPTLAATDNLNEIVLPACSENENDHDEKIVSQRRSLWSTQRKEKEANVIEETLTMEAEENVLYLLINRD